MTREEIFQNLKEDIKSITGETHEIEQSDTLKDDLGLDSLDLVQLVIATESRYNLSIPDEGTDELDSWTVGEYINYLEPAIR